MNKAIIGHNNPPESLFETAQEKLNDFYEEAQLWLDGTSVKTQIEADAVSKLLSELNTVDKLIESNRKIEKKPFDDGGKAVQTKYKPLKSKAELAKTACKKALEPFLLEKDRIKREIENQARVDAEKARIEAEAAARNANPANLIDQEIVQELEHKSQDATAFVKIMEKDKAQAKGGSRAVGLRTVWETRIVDSTIAARHYWKSHKAEIETLLLNIAKAEVRTGVRNIDGFEITETKVV